MEKNFEDKKNLNKDNKKENEKKNEKENSFNSNFLKTNNNIKNDKLKIDEEAVKFVTNFGYKKEYVIKSIELNEINHATATYYLKLSLNNNN